ncbi:cation diffusion facilitator family transporter [Gorillibacterium timonense]|uniref:cation diffusion facilitator family transporter n=1 Tax=Gorillibacterium timonense TaxID=1689269 RepID=UPI00071C84C9|nr:cation diffusion facilitator family transporter [Gorillibacterium timonense]
MSSQTAKPAKKFSPAIWGAWISLLSNLALTVMKLGVGMLFGSQVLVADGVHNAGDVIASGATLSSMRISNRPADEDHPYGHGKAEVLGAALVAIILALASVYMAVHSIQMLFQEPAAPHILPLVAAFVSLFWKLILYFYTIRIGREAGSKGLIATANDHLADVYASAAAVLGIMLSLIGEQISSPYLAYGDPIAGIIVSLLVMRLAYTMGRESLDVLMEHSVDLDILKDYAALIRTIPEVKRIDRLRGRNHGHYIIVDIRVSIPGYLTIQEGHDIGRAIKKVITKAHPDVGEVLVHLNPWYETDVT